LPPDSCALDAEDESVARRGQRGIFWCIVTSNKPFGCWGEVFDDNLAAAMIGQLVHHAEIIACELGNLADLVRPGHERWVDGPSREKCCTGSWPASYIWYVGDSDSGSTAADGDASIQSDGRPQDRQEWVRANFARIFGTSAEDLRAQGISPGQYAREHRDQIRQFAQLQRSQGFVVPGGRAAGGRRPGNTGFTAGEPNSGYGWGGGRYGWGMRGGTAWIGALIALFALRFLLVDSFAGRHAALLWVLEIGGIMLVARILLFSWLRRRRHNRRQ
jgi:hypothetical protein